MRNLAALVGVTHQKIGRWLRGEAKRGIPPDVIPAINAAFRYHKEITKAQAKVDRFPHVESAPMFVNRPTLKNGKPGERVYIENTQYISKALRDRYLSDLHKTKVMHAVSVRSEINLYSYTGTAPKKGAAGIANNFNVVTDKDQLGRQTAYASFERREAISPGKGYIAPLYTPITQFSAPMPLRIALKELDARLKQKHEPHAITLGDQILIQTVPGQYDKPIKPSKGKKYRESLKRR